MGRFWDAFKEAAGDQARGSMKYGVSTSYRHNAAAIRAGREERLAREARTQQSQRLGEAAVQASQTGHQIYEYLKSSGQLSKASNLLENADYKVTVKRDYSKIRKCFTVDLIIVDKSVKDKHIHAVYEEESGREVICEWRKNH
jgi:exonuclease VII large subunit